MNNHLRLLLTGTVCSALLVFAACADSTRPLPRVGAPDVLEFSIGGYGGTSTAIEVQGETVTMIQVPWDWEPGSAIDTVRTDPSPEAWRAFWTTVQEAGVSNWKSSYRAEGIVDGIGWSLLLEGNGQRIESQGSNAYPDRDGREHEDETSGFQSFTAALEALTGVPLW